MGKSNIPDRKASLIGGPFDGLDYVLDVWNWEPDEVRYHRYFEEGIVDHITLFNRKFPEGAVYCWNEEERCWKYKGLPNEKSREGFSQLFKSFNIKPAEPL